MRTFGEYIIYYENSLIDESNMKKLIATGLLGTAIGMPIGFNAADNIYKNRYERKPISSEAKPRTYTVKKPSISKNYSKIGTHMKSNDKIEKPVVRDSTMKFIKSLENFDSNAYSDGFGNLTIGYGFTKYVFPKLKKGDTITREEAKEQLYNLLKNEYEPFIHKMVNVPISQEQFDALISWVYNVGITAARKSTLLRKINNEEYESTASEFLRWDKVGSKSVPGLANRRREESSLFRSGIAKLDKTDNS